MTKVASVHQGKLIRRFAWLYHIYVSLIYSNSGEGEGGREDQDREEGMVDQCLVPGDKLNKTHQKKKKKSMNHNFLLLKNKLCFPTLPTEKV